MAAATTIPSINTAGWAQRLVNLTPQDWTNDAAKSIGGVLYALMSGIGSQKAFLNTGVIWAFNATRIHTATDSALDTISQDYFGTTLPRQSGEADASFRNRILNNFFLPAATRPAMISRIQGLTGVTPRVMESWYAPDTCYYDCISYWDIDVQTSAPFRWGDPSLRYQGFVETVLPPLNTALANNFPIWCLDAGFSWDANNSYWLDPSPTWFLQTVQMDALINAIRPFGTIVWRKYGSQPLVGYAIGGSRNVAANNIAFNIGVLPFAGPYIALAQPNWNTNAYIGSQSNAAFSISFTDMAPSGASFDFVAAPVTLVGVGSVPVMLGQSSVTIAVPTGRSAYLPMSTPNWPTNVWISSISSSSVTFSFNEIAPNLAVLNFMFFAPTFSGVVPVTAGQTTVSFPLAGAPAAQFELFVIPDWNTTTSIVSKNQVSATVQFSNPAPGNQLLRYGYQNG
jgi:hypothetical protein